MTIARPGLITLLALTAASAAWPEAAPARPKKQYTIEQFMATTSVGGASFSPDESKILFSSNVTGIFNVYSVSVNGGEPTALTSSTTDTTQAVAYFPADERVLFTRDHGGNELNHLYVRDLGGQERDLTPGEKLKASFEGFNRAGTAFHVLSNERDPRYFDLYRYDAKTYARSLVYKDEVGYFFGDVSDDGRWIAFGKVQTTADSDIYLYDTASKQMKHLTPHLGQVANSVAGFDPDGKALYYLTNEGGEFARVKSYALLSGRHEEVEKADWDVSFTAFSHGGRYRVTAINEDGRTVIRMHDLKAGQPVVLPQLPAADITSLAISRSEKRLAFYVNGDRSPSNLYVYTLGEAAPRRLTQSLDKDIDPEDLVEAEVVRFESFDGMAVPNILWKPLQATAENKAPALVWVHGGPGGQTRKGYSALIQYLVNHGYVVLGINNRGSSGYGKTFFTADDQKHGREPLWDCVAAKKYLSSLPYVDQDRIGIIGGSYGGYMVLGALAFQPDVFGVGVDIFGVSNWLRTLEGIPSWWEAQRVALYKEIGDPVAQKDMLKEISPVFHADKIKKPLLVLQGANDPRVIKAESDDIVAAVKKSGVPVEYIVFPDEGHGFTKRANEIKGYGAILRFLDQYLKGAAGSPSGPGLGALDQGEALRDAARAGDVAGVRALLDLGVSLEAEARHGQTALYFAADKGHLEVVRLLVERGANVNVRDRFFKGSALGLALGNDHLDVARYLLAHGATDADAALQAAVARGDVELARAALDSARIEPLELLAARRAADEGAAKGEKGAPEVQALLKTAKVAPPKRTPFAATPDRLRAYAGRYRDGPAGEARVELRGSGLVLSVPEKPELVTNGRTIRGYDPKTGILLWTLGPNSEVVVATPVVSDGVVHVTAGYPPVRPVYAVRPGQRGDLTLPDGESYLYTVNNNGILTCYRADTGEQAYQTRLGGGPVSFAASPVAADGRIYFASETGEVYVVKAGPEQELVATNTMDEVTMATPAIADGLMVFRTLGHVVGLAEPTKAASR